MDTIEELKRRIKELEELVETIDRRRRLGWRHYFLKERISLPKTCPWCETGLLIVKPITDNGGVYAACSNYPLMCRYYVKDKKKEFNAYKLKYGM